VARVGLNPDSGVRYRSYFDFPISFLSGKHVESAYVQMRLDHSWSCGNTVTHLFHTAGIASTPRTRWAPAHRQWMASAESHANEGSGCSDSPQPDMTVNFQSATIRAVMQNHATARSTQVTVGFCACNANGEYESAQDRWKKFFPNYAKLIVDYSNYPGRPTGLQVSGVTCPASGQLSIGTLTPTLSAVYPDADDTQALTAAFEWLEIPASGTYNDATPRKPSPGNRSVPAGDRGTSNTLSGVQSGKRYAFRTRATDPAPYSLISPWSAWCEFAPDTTVPPPPTITAATLPTGPGTGGTFTFSVAASDAVKFRYGWSSPPLNEVAATGTTTRTASVSLTAPFYGQNTLYVHAIDATGNKGNDATLELAVTRPAPPLARWALETRPGVDQPAALADQQPALGGDTPLAFTPTGPDVRFAPDARLIGGSAATFNPTGDGLGGWLEAPVPALDTSRSFAVSAWVRLFSHSGYQTVLGKDGAQMSVFRLQYRPDDDKWCFTLRARDVVSAARIARACAVKPVLGQWTHLAGVYDDTEQRVRLYVDGALVSDVAPDAAWLTEWAGGWNATGPVTVGRGLDRGNATTPLVDHFKGEVADVQIFARALVGHDFTGQRAGEPESGGFDEPGIIGAVEVGRWDFGAAAPCYEAGIPDTCRAPDVGPWGRELSFSAGVDVGLGQRDTGLLLDSTHWIDDPADPHYGATTQEYGRSRRNTAPAGQPPQWQDTPVLRTDQSFTVSAWVNPATVAGGNKTVVAQESVAVSGFFLGTRSVGGVLRWTFFMKDADSLASTGRHATSTAVLTEEAAGRWTHLVGVYDAQRKEVRLYVDGVLQGAPVARPGPGWHASGPLTVGRAWWNGAVCDWWNGAIDDVNVYQGALTGAEVSILHHAQSASTEPGGM
jgi:hypothetical protein